MEKWSGGLFWALVLQRDGEICRICDSSWFLYFFTKKTRLVRTSRLPRVARRDLSYESENSRFRVFVILCFIFMFGTKSGRIINCRYCLGLFVFFARYLGVGRALESLVRARSPFWQSIGPSSQFWCRFGTMLTLCFLICVLFSLEKLSHNIFWKHGSLMAPLAEPQTGTETNNIDPLIVRSS